MGRNRNAFTLVEVMVATAILSLGIVVIFESLLSLTRSYEYCAGYITSSAFAHEMVWEATDNVRHEGVLNPASSGEFSRGGRKFDWGLFLENTGGDTLYKVTMRVKWSTGARVNEISRAEYVIYEKPE